MADDSEEQVGDPKGVVGLFIDPDGRVVAEVTDFERSGYGDMRPQPTNWQPLPEPPVAA